MTYLEIATRISILKHCDDIICAECPINEIVKKNPDMNCSEHGVKIALAIVRENTKKQQEEQPINILEIL